MLLHTLQVVGLDFLSRGEPNAARPARPARPAQPSPTRSQLNFRMQASLILKKATAHTAGFLLGGAVSSVHPVMSRYLVGGVLGVLGR